MNQDAREEQDDTTDIGDKIASAAIEAYAALPKHGRPTIRPNGVPEWTILAAIYVVVPRSDLTASPPLPPTSGTTARGSTHRLSPSGATAQGSTHRLVPVSLGAGVKVLPAVRLPPLGDTVHDCHAEVLARRGFVRWLILEASRVLRGEPHEGALEWLEGKFRLKRGVETWLYVSALPCGDASTVHTAHHQPPDMATLKSSSGSYASRPPPSASASPSPVPVPVPFPPSVDVTLASIIDTTITGLETSTPSAVRGRNGYTAYGAIRTKPGRADSVPTISMSCSDKIASWAVLGLQGGLLEPLFSKIPLHSIVVGGWEAGPGWRELEDASPEAGQNPSPHDYRGPGSGGTWRGRMIRELRRALYGRLEHIDGKSRPIQYLPDEYKLHRPEIHLTSISFPFSRSAAFSGIPLLSTHANVRGSDQESKPTTSIPVAVPVLAQPPPEPVPTVTALVYVPCLSGAADVLFNGTRVGGKWKSPGTELVNDRARSVVCKYEILRAFVQLREMEEPERLEHPATAVRRESLVGEARARSARERTYFQHKHPPDSSYQQAKAILRGVVSKPDDGVQLPDVFARYGRFGITVSHEGQPTPPFVGWLVSGEAYENFIIM